MHRAVLEAGQITIEPQEQVSFESSGRCLLIGPADILNRIMPRLSALSLYGYASDERALEADESVTVIRQPLTELTGWLGAFQARFGEHELTVDLVLDLGDTPMITSKVPPLGYFAPGEDPQALAEALQQLPELVGEFDKPRFFDYNPDICAHSRRGVKGCTNCIDACPAEAVSSGGDLINVNPNLCQGCGSCTVVCPSGAISYALPTLDISVNRLRQMMQEYGHIESQPPQLLIHDENLGLQQLEAYEYPLADDVLPFSIEEIGALGQPFWLTAFAYGVSRILIWDAGSHEDHDWQELQRSMQESNAMLAELGLSDRRIDYFHSREIEVLQSSLAQSPQIVEIEPARFAGVNDKRRMTTMALSHLHHQAPQQPALMSLSADAAFGEITVDKQACTLCMSCVSVCPVGAVVDGVDQPQLHFIEDLCVQCGLCETACPEDAIALVPRYVFDRNQARQKRLLHEEPVFNCIRCNKAFATQKMIDTMIGKLSDHPMFQGQALDRLKMCEDCRVKSMFNQ
ncbi:MAG: 4Fe-4S ferredoxin [Methylophaga sp.]|nr:4Fe-4S ferredoxin [Methylophaga sp.]